MINLYQYNRTCIKSLVGTVHCLLKILKWAPVAEAPFIQYGSFTLPYALQKRAKRIFYEGKKNWGERVYFWNVLKYANEEVGELRQTKFRQIYVDGETVNAELILEESLQLVSLS